MSGSYKGATPITEKIRSTGSGGSFIDLMLDEDASEVFCACLIGVANNQLCAFVYDGNGNSALGSYWAGSRFLDAEAAISFPNPGFVRFDFSDSQCPTPAERDAWVTYIPV